VDEQNGMIFHYPGGQIAMLTSGFRANTDREAYVFGTKGNIKLDAAWHRSLKVTLYRNEKKKAKEIETTVFREDDPGLNHQADHVNECLIKGITESPIMPLDETLVVMEIMDELRDQWGVHYP
jgi:predicted dehydrogenase